jgi:periplasmic copper chaperone A
MKKSLKHLFLAALVAASHGIACAQEAIQIKNPWVRPGIAGKNTAMYFDVETKEAVSLTNVALEVVSSGVAELTELHSHINENGIMKMREVKAIKCHPGITSLKPGGDHVMLMQLRQDLKEGDTVTVTLDFSNGYQTNVTAPVKKPKQS